MPNMSYCRFSNTLADLKDCADALYNGCESKDMNREERGAMLKLIDLCNEIAEWSMKDEA